MPQIDRYEIDDCLVHMFDCMDLFEYDRVGESFHADAHFTFAFSRQDRLDNKLTMDVSGREPIVDFFRLSFSGLEQTHHTLSNISSKISGETAHTSVHIRAYHKGKSNDLFEESLGVAKVVFAKKDGAVRISKFDYTVLIVLGSVEVFAPAGFDK